MSEFISVTINDMRGGRESWRVLVFFAVPAFILAFAGALVVKF
jgi:uncharacterized membrane protein YfcA